MRQSSECCCQILKVPGNVVNKVKKNSVKIIILVVKHDISG